MGDGFSRGPRFSPPTPEQFADDLVKDIVLQKVTPKAAAKYIVKALEDVHKSTTHTPSKNLKEIATRLECVHSDLYDEVRKRIGEITNDYWDEMIPEIASNTPAAHLFGKELYELAQLTMEIFGIFCRLDEINYEKTDTTTE